MSQDLPKAGSGEMFDAIAPRYDLLNRIISLGIDQSWRRKLVASLSAALPRRILDLATGTGDVAVMVSRAYPEVSVVGVDPSTKMLEVGREKIEKLGLAQRISFEVGSAERLPFEDDSFDGVTIAFGIRNVPDRAAALREMSRVVKRGGRVAVLELSEPRSGLLGPLARFHIHTVVPTIGGLLSGSREYSYLQESIAAFPPPEQFAEQMGSSGLEVLSVEPLTFGVSCLYVATPSKG